MTPPSPHSQNTSSVKLDFTLILASASPRRAELLQQAGYEFFVMVSPVSEPTRRPSSVPVRLWPACVAGIKAQAVAKRFIKPTIVLAADTIVVLGKQIINKAADRKQAREILWRLSEREHQVVTGIALMLGDHCRFASEVSVCKMRKVSEAWLKDYLNSELVTTSRSLSLSSTRRLARHECKSSASPRQGTTTPTHQPPLVA